MPARMFSAISISRWERTSWSRSTSTRRDKKRFRRKLRAFAKSGTVNTSTTETTRNQDLFVTQRNHWVYLGGPPCRNETSQQRCANEEQCHSAESEWIGGSHAKEQRLHSTRQGQRTGNPNCDTNEDRAQSLAQDHPQNVAGAGAESDTHANFARAAADRIGHHAKHPCRCEQQRGDSEESDENDVESPRAERSGIHLRKRPKPGRNLRVEILQDSPRRGSDQAGVGVTEHRYGDGRARPLEQIHIDGGARRRIEAIFVSVAHDADDGQQA